ncbi:hypothetical protein [Sediminibacterium ginsengisoli]|uniref:Uncharacterized protein n=1 Tax=Sediminibacterium ginsengisoli TaxID=413434 RepID=A0A1T4M8A0_9BACT|nr:hypothetical protein [Sediminibacterium ginsengisoli]SJZ62924.1 hypothetical protein SAMN04488132_103226 [Sediminibacterium ginsengisoli]
MKKLLGIIAFLIAAGYTVQAQGNANEAKAAYLLAEECYGKADYKCTLDYLKQARTILDGTNCKILYLQIMASRELYAKSPYAADMLLPLIEEFEKSPDHATFNEEKSLEITKMKLALKNAQRLAAEQKKEKEAADKAAVEKSFTTALYSAGPYGVSMEELDRAKPSWNLKKWKKTDIGAIQVYYDANLFSISAENFPFATNRKIISTPNPITGIITADNKIIGYLVQLLELDQEKSTFSTTYDQVKKTSASFVEGFKITFGKEYTTRSFTALRNPAVLTDWRKGSKGVSMMQISFPQGRAGVAKLVELLYDDPAGILDTLIK